MSSDSHIEENHDDSYQPSPNEELERKIFMQELNKFMSENGKPLSKIPIMGYKELDLFQLFREVTNFGGFNEVVKNVGTWSKIWKKLPNFDPSITDSSFRLKKNYERYLLDYEYKSNPELRHQALDSEKHYQKRFKDNTPSPPLSRQQSFTQQSSHHVSSPSSLSIINLTPNAHFEETSHENNAIQIQNSFEQPNNNPTITTQNNSISNLLNSDNHLPSFSFQNHSPTLSPSKKERPLKKNQATKLEKLAIESVMAIQETRTPSPKSTFNSSFMEASSTSPKKSRNKEPLVTLVSSVQDQQSIKIPRDNEGLPILPLDLGDFVLESLGTVIPRPPFTTDKHIWPIGFRISRYFQSLNNPHKLVKYTCSITDGGDRPLFLILPEDEAKPIQTHSPSASWRAIFKKLASKISSLNDSNTSILSRKNINGSLRFGLCHPVVIQLIKEVAAAVEKSPLPSPPYALRKRKSLTDLSSSSCEEPMEGDNEQPLKFPRVEIVHTLHSSEEIVFNTPEELQDLEIAVATLNALKFCTVY